MKDGGISNKPRRLGDVLEHAFKGKLEFFYEEEAYLVRVNWTREE